MLFRSLARAHERAVELGEDVRKRGERLGDRAPGDHLAAQRREHLAAALVLGLLDQRVESLLDRETCFEQRCEAARELRIGRSLAYELARRYLDSGERDGLPVIRLGAACLRVPRWALDELRRTGRVVALHDEVTG